MNFNNIDNPISTTEKDLLGFTSLAKKVATSITDSNIDTTNSFTISIEGAWGSGKTSLVNLIKNDIRDKTVIMEFNPWIVTNFEHLVQYFFSELLKEIIHENFDAKLKEDIWKDIKKFVSFFTPEKVRIGFGDLKVTYSPKKMLFQEKEETLLELKRKINRYLKQLDKKIVIIIDDIDRLTDKETEIFFRLIKGIADFDNIIYLLLFDKTIVSKSLETFKQENGEKYLDKIIQYSLSVPKPHQGKVETILFNKLDNILKDIPKHYFNKEKWDVVAPQLGNYFHNIRDINRVLSIMSFEYPQIAEEINFFDFFILSLIRVQNFELYEAIKNKQHIFHEYTLDKRDNKYQERAKKYFEDTLKDFKKYELLLNFFIPILDPYSDFYTISKHRDKSLIYDEYFDKYFNFTVADDSISQSDFSKLSNKLVSSDFTIFKEKILAINEPSKSNLFFDMFSEQEIKNLQNNINGSRNAIKNLLSISSYMKDEESILNMPLSTKIHRQACKILKNTNNQEIILTSIYFESNYIALKDKLDFYKSIYTANLKEGSSFKLVNSLLEKIKERLSEDIKDITIRDIINNKNIPKYGNINFYNLSNSFILLDISIEELKKELNNLIFKSKDNFFKVLYILRSTIYINSVKTYVIHAENIKDYIELEKIESYIEKLDKESFTQNEKSLLEAWNLRFEY